MELSIVIPAFNEEQRLPRTLDRIMQAFERAGYSDYEFVIVDDGSKDRTVELVEEAARASGGRIRLIRQPRNMGRGVAVRTGILDARGDYVLETDADGSVDEEAFLRFVRELRSHPELGVLIGSRRMPGAEILTPQPWLRVFLGKGFVFLSRLLIDPSIVDFSLGFKMFRRDASRDIFAFQVDNRYLAEAEIIYIAQVRGWLMKPMPIRWTDFSDSRIKPFKDAMRTLNGYVGIFRRAWSGFYRRDLPVQNRPIPDFGIAARFVKTLYAGNGWPSLFARIRFWTAPYRALEPLIPKEGTIVDVGCGYGLFTNLLALMSPRRRMIGFDTDAGKMRYADRGVEHASFRNGDAMQLEPGEADAFLLIHVLHHLKSKEEQVTLLKNIRARLRAGGTLLVCEVDRRPFWRFILAWLTDHVLYFGDRIYYRSPKQLVTILEDAGFEVSAEPMYVGTPYSHITFVCGAVDGRPVPHVIETAPDDRNAWLAWWFGVPILTFLSVFGPYWVWDLIHHYTPFWRTPIFYGAIFDITWYLPLIGSVVSGFHAGNYLHWFAIPLGWLARMMPGASVPEVWFVSRWITTTIMVWISPWCFRRWADLSRGASRIFSLAFWFSIVLALGMRPGIYSWWYPAVFFALTASRIVLDDLRKNHPGRAFAWTLAALLFGWLYTWFFILCVIWLASMWAIWLFRNKRGLIGTACVVGFFALPFVAYYGAHWLFSGSHVAYWQMYERIGLAYSHMPYLTNSFLIVPGWIALLLCLPRWRRMNEREERGLVAMQWAWIALLFAWQCSVFMGVALDNDHFRSPTVLLCWISFAWLWSVLRAPAASEPPRRARGAWIFDVLTLGTLAVSLVFIYRILASGYVFFDEYLNVLHFSHWFILALAAWCLWRYARSGKPSAAFPANGIIAIALVVSIVSGVSASAHIYAVELVRLPGMDGGQQLVDFLRATVPVDQAVCADPVTAGILGIHIARLTHPTVMSKMLPQTDAQALNTLTTLAGAYDVVGSGFQKSFKRFVRMDRYIPCASYLKTDAVLKRLGVSDATIQRLDGCPITMLDQEQQIFQQALDLRTLDPAAFQSVCPWVVITPDQRAYWRLPANYVERAFPSGTSVWSPYLGSALVDQAAPAQSMSVR